VNTTKWSETSTESTHPSQQNVLTDLWREQKSFGTDGGDSNPCPGYCVLLPPSMLMNSEECDWWYRHGWTVKRRCVNGGYVQDMLVKRW